MKILIGIPAYNEEQMIGKVIASLPQKIAGVKTTVLVVDDGSNDQTADIAQKMGVMVVKHLSNRGLGGALKTIFAFAKEYQFDILITFDADGQHEAQSLKIIIKPLREDRADIVIGARWQKIKNGPLSRYIINRLANLMTFLLFGVWTTDSQSGLRACNNRAINVINLQTDGMEVSSEFFKEIARNRLRLTEIPIRAVYTEYSRKKGQKIENSLNVLINLLLRLLR